MNRHISNKIFSKFKPGYSWLDVSLWHAGIIVLLLLPQIYEISGACTCDSSVPQCLQSITNETTASCSLAPREDCPCCRVCAAQLDDLCGPSHPCDSSKGLICKDNVCQKQPEPCVSEGRKYLQDETYYTQNCQTKCTCGHNGQELCQPTVCRSGLLIKGFLTEDPMCEERRVDPDDDCCVLVVCSSIIEEAETTPPDSGRVDNPKTTTLTIDSTTEAIPSSDLNANFFSNLEFLQITPTTIQVQFPGITGGNLMYVEERLFKGDGHDSFGHSATPWENAIILEGNKIFTLTGLKSKTTYRIRWQAPNKQYPDLMVDTNAVDEKPPKVIVSSKTFDSITLSFDHFAPEDYHHGYVALYKESNSGRWINHEEGDSIDTESFMRDIPTITITKLKPNTEYMAKIAIYNDYSTRSLGRSTSVIEFKTGKGCFYENESHPLGSFLIGCEFSCVCHDDGNVECSDRCIAPLQPSGKAKDDPLCVEQFAEDDKCCVHVTCAGDTDEDNPEGPCNGIKCGPNAECRHEVLRGENAETICVCKEGYLGDPDSPSGCGDHIASKDKATVRPKEGCIVKNETYKVNDDWFDGCDYKCTCSKKLEIICQPRCKSFPKVTNENCELRPDQEDACCKVMFCPDPKAMDDLRPVSLPFDGCLFKNTSYNQGERFYDGCEQQCQCMGYGDIVCLSRCPPTAPAPGQNCITLPDASDPCCNITVCDKPVPDPDENVQKEAAKDLSKQPRVFNEADSTDMDSAITEEPTESPLEVSKLEKGSRLEESLSTDFKCMFGNSSHNVGSEFFDECENYCMCHLSEETGQPEVICNPINCPSAFGLDIINPFCLEWDNHDNYDAQAPNCCPPQPVCIHDGTCEYEGQKFNNFDNIPANLTGCEKRCYCENGVVSCQDACHDIPSEPPGYLSCSATVAIKIQKEDRPCCQTWGCPKLGKLPDKLQSVVLDAVNETAIRVHVRVPKEIDGRSGYFKVYFSEGLEGHPDPEKWPSLTINPKNGLFKVDDNEETSFLVSQLLPKQEYFLKVAMHVRDPETDKVIVSNIVSVRTPEVPLPKVEGGPVLELRRIEVNLTVDNVMSKSAFLSWRFFTLDEKQFLDGVQIRFTVLQDGSPASGVPGTTPFIHRDTNFFLLEDLKPDTEYEVDLYLIPVPNATTELISTSTKTFRTNKPELDPYEFEILLKPEGIYKQFVDISWSGVPSPHQKFVNIYRILFMEDHVNSLEGRSIFKVAKIDSSRAARISHLKPGTKYQVWLEAYLRNGKVMQSNVLEITTEDGAFDPNSDYDESQEPFTGTHDSFYYKSMVAAIVIAVIVSAILIALVSVFLKRAITYKAIISGTGNRGATSSTTKASDHSTLSARGSGVAKSDSFEMNGMRTSYNGNGSAVKPVLETA